MKCDEAAKLMHGYLDGRLDAAQRKALEGHRTKCAKCRKEMELVKRLRREGSREEGIRAPDGFTDMIMTAVYRLPPERGPRPVGMQDARWKPVYRRLGYSLILTAGIILFCIVAPGAGLHPESISGKVHSGIESSGSGYKGFFTRIDDGIMGLFKAQDDSHTEFEGGSDNGMQKS